MNKNIPTPHNSAKEGDFAETVLMPGDPCRAEFIAKDFLTDAVKVNDVRGIKGFTGTYKGKKVSVMASGMGQPSMGIYSYELFNFYGVKRIIRVGSMGGYDKDLHVKDIVIALGACTNGNYAAQYRLPGTFCPLGDYGLAKKAEELCIQNNINYKVGNILSSDTFYGDASYAEEWGKMGVLGVEMEAYALYCNAVRAKKSALCICTVSDSFVHNKENLSSEEREKGFSDMIKIALELA